MNEQKSAPTLVTRNPSPRVAADPGMLLCTVIVSSGYFLARRELPVAAMFAALAALTVTALAVAVTWLSADLAGQRQAPPGKRRRQDWTI